MEKIKLTIAGESYSISTDDDLDYVASLGEELDRKTTAILAGNSRLSVTQAAVLTSLDCLDCFKKSLMTSENLRSQIKSYLEDAARARADFEIAKKENQKLADEIKKLTKENKKLTKELEKLSKQMNNNG